MFFFDSNWITLFAAYAERTPEMLRFIMLPKRAICYNTVRSFELIIVVFALYSATTFYRRTPGVRTIFLLRASMSFTHFSLRYLQNGAKQRKLFEAYARCTPSAGTFFFSARACALPNTLYFALGGLFCAYARRTPIQNASEHPSRRQVASTYCKWLQLFPPIRARGKVGWLQLIASGFNFQPAPVAVARAVNTYSGV